MKKCPKCNIEKPLNLFYVRTGKRAGKPSAYCKECLAIYSHQHYRDNKGNGKHSAHKKYILKCKEHVRAIKESTPCKDCGKNYPYYIMQFDHLRDKRMSISQLFTKAGLPKIKEEIEKCEIVCANCHAERTHKRRNQLD